MKNMLGKISIFDEKLKAVRYVIFSLLLLTAVLTAGQLGCGDLPSFSDLAPHGPFPEGTMYISAVDVGQGDCILVRHGEYSVLIDGGENGMGDRVLDFLDSQGVDELTWVIGTHPHSDHIGGLDTVINGIKVDNVMLTRHSDDNTPSTKTYNDLLNAILESGLQVTPAQTGDCYTMGGMTMTVLSSGESYTDYNQSSIVLFFDFGDTDFITGGDIDKYVEADLLEKYDELGASVMKVSHHGSAQSNSEEFLRAVSPDIALITVGANNDYGHPSDTVLERLRSIGAEYHRTDIEGSITVACDGEQSYIIGG